MEGPELEYVGFWLRVWASIIDTVLVMVILLPIVHAYGVHAYGGNAYWGDAYWPSVYTGTGPTWVLLTWVLPAVAVLIFWVTRQATPGKMAIGAKIVDAATGQRPSGAQFLGRYLAYYVSTLFFCLGFLWVGIDARKQGWHDKLAGTIVVRPRRGVSAVQFKSP